MKKNIKLNSTTLCFFVLFSLFIFRESMAKTYYVAATGSDSNDGIITPFKTIQKAADIVVPGDIVIVRNGIYTDHNSDNIVVNISRGGSIDNWVIFKAENKWGAVLDGNNYKTGYGFNLNANYVRIEYFDFQHFSSHALHSNAQAQNVYIYGCKFHHIGRICTDTPYGIVGVQIGKDASYHTIDSCVFHTIGRLNPSEGCNLDISYFYSNDHAIYPSGQHIDIINSVFYDIKAGWPIQIAGSYGSANYYNIINNTFFGSNPMKYGQIILWGGMHDILIQNNIFYAPNKEAINLLSSCSALNNITIRNNLTNISSIVTEPCTFIISGNIIEKDPLFLNTSKNNYHLQSNSPAIDMGYPDMLISNDNDGNLRPQNGSCEIGAYEYYATASTTTILDITPPAQPTGLGIQ